MKQKRNIYDADDAARSKRLRFSAEERAAHAEKKAEVLGQKLEKAKAEVPKQYRPRIKREFDSATGKVRPTLHFEEEVRPRGKKNPAAKGALKAGRTANLAVHNKIRQVEHENVGTETAHKTEFAAENMAAGAVKSGYRYAKDTPYRKVDKLKVKSAKATVNANYRAAVRDNPELQKHSLSAMYQKRRVKREYAKAYREAHKNGRRGAAAVKKAKEAVGNIGYAAVTVIKSNKGVLLLVGGIALLLIMVFSSLSSCSVTMEGAMGAVLGTSYTSEDPDILQVNNGYTDLEKQLERRMANIESEFPGYDEYQYDVDTIGHDPNELISHLTAKFNAFTPAQVQTELQALFDPSFAALITEAEKYLGYPYVWGGSSPSTSFDCSGFVCYVYTHSGVHNLPRTTATGIYNQCAIVSRSEAKPGDLIFFTKTYNSDGPVSHVGIYVGDGMMIHCGSPIQYANINSSYWQEHFYAFGRL